ncbi:MerR family transcriptional regulator [Arsenicitalea aurantiaca]|uniref:MerR family transcriptional regulator n=1 Tax=Arsenicitalea aurantiaca TaxID=1783274 RepID=A0A433XEM7_9HYPH|nr:MerR family transcriptional regulator [Arsenicitalea aurantiaca]RUT32551.1 MerR family transcriptional regulator [Arsenicitalea aurantiaca]
MEKSPDAFRTISEAAEELDLPQHVLRFWETRFAPIKPLKRGGGRRYYRPEDVLLLKGIRHLLYDKGFTIKGVQRILKDQGVRYVMAIGEGGSIEHIALPPGGAEPDPAPDTSVEAPLPDDAQPAPIVSAPRDIRPEAPAIPMPSAPVRAQARVLDEKDREKLASVLRELLDCKRLLERAREN